MNIPADRLSLVDLAPLVFAITVINAWNRLAITTRAQTGNYQPGALPKVA